MNIYNYKLHLTIKTYQMNTLFKKVTTRTPRTFTTTIKFFSTTAKPQKDWKDKKILVAGSRG